MAKHYWKLRRLSLFYAHYAYMDTSMYLADRLFIQHEVPVDFLKEFSSKEDDYRCIICRVRKKDEKAFVAALEELPNRMAVCGNTDYMDCCSTLDSAFAALKKGETA